MTMPSKLLKYEYSLYSKYVVEEIEYITYLNQGPKDFHGGSTSFYKARFSFLKSINIPLQLFIQRHSEYLIMGKIYLILKTRSSKCFGKKKYK